MKPWSDLHPLVLPDVVGCPVPLVDQALMLTARDFCLRTSAWTEWADPFSAPGLTNRFDFDLPSGAELVRVTRAVVDGEDVDVLPSRSLPADWATATSHGDLRALVHIDLTEYLILPLPADGISVHIEMALRPSMSATGAGNVLFDKHAEALSWGTKERLMLQRGKPWTDLPTASIARTQYLQAVASAANEAWRTSGHKRVRKAVI